MQQARPSSTFFFHSHWSRLPAFSICKSSADMSSLRWTHEQFEYPILLPNLPALCIPQVCPVLNCSQCLFPESECGISHHLHPNCSGRHWLVAAHTMILPEFLTREVRASLFPVFDGIMTFCAQRLQLSLKHDVVNSPDNHFVSPSACTSHPLLSSHLNCHIFTPSLAAVTSQALPVVESTYSNSRHCPQSQS